jgi:cell wall-associated NlpC family hydrolase
MARQKWPAEGSADFSVGQSRLSNVLGTLSKTLYGGVAAIKDDAVKKNEEASDAAVAYMLSKSSDASSTTDDSTESSEGGVDSSKAQAIVDTALSFVPKKEGGTSSKNYPYHWASAGPGKCSGVRENGPPEGGSYKHDCCFDCSGFTSYVYKKAVNIKLTAYSQAICDDKKGRDIFTNPSAKDLKSDKVLPGDVVLFKKKGASSTHHVAICMGNGTGKMVHAPETGKHVTTASILTRSDTYKIRRFLPESAYTSGGASTSKGTAGGYKAGQKVKEIDIVITTYNPQIKGMPGYSKKKEAMEGGAHCANMGDIKYKPSSPMGYQTTYRKKKYDYVCAVPQHSDFGDLLFTKASSGDPKYGFYFKGWEDVIWVAFDHYASGAKGASADLMCFDEDKYKDAMWKAMRKAKTKKTGGNGYSDNQAMYSIVVVKLVK